MKNLQRSLVLAAAIVPLMSALASAQYRIDNGNARDANNRIGSGGYNDGRYDDRVRDARVYDSRVGGLPGNYVVTGNVTGGRAFRGNLGYTDPTAFRGSLGSADFDPFVRDSTGVAQIRGGYGSNANTVQPFFGGRTVTTPPGFVSSPANNGSFIPRTTTVVQPNDTRVDYGGAPRAAVTQSLNDVNASYGNTGYPNPTFQFSSDNPYGANFGGTPAPLQLSEFTTLARQRQNLFGTSDPTGSLDTRINPQTGLTTPNNPFETQNTITRQPTQPQDTNTPTDPNDPRNPAAMPIGSQPDNSDNSLPGRDIDSRPGATGQSLSITRPGRRSALDNNAQYAQLRERLEQARTGNRSPNADGTLGGPMDTRVSGGAVSTGQGRITTSIRDNNDASANDANPDAANPANGNPANGNGVQPNGQAMPGQPGALPGAQPGAQPGMQPGQPSDTRLDPRGGTNAGARPNGSTGGAATPNRNGLPADQTTRDLPPENNLGLPHPDATAPQAKGPPAPVQINSLATGVKNPKLTQILKDAEDQMKNGKFGSAIDSYERAQELATDDPLVFMGRGIAELGGGFYRNAEVHLRQAFASDESLLYAKFDLRGMIGDERLNQLTTNLGKVANDNANDPGPMLLLAFIYYNAGMEDKAARALDMAQLRANGKDQQVELLRRSWSLGATPGDQAPGDQTSGDRKPTDTSGEMNK